MKILQDKGGSLKSPGCGLGVIISSEAHMGVFPALGPRKSSHFCDLSL